MDTQWLQDISAIQPEGWPCQLTGAVHVWVDVWSGPSLVCLNAASHPATHYLLDLFSRSVCWGLTFDRISYGDIQDCL